MTDRFRIDGKIAVVIGGAGGIGEAVGNGLAQFGAKVVLASRNLPNLQKAARGIMEKWGTDSKAFQVDVTDEHSFKHLVEKVVEGYGTVDILVNSQGINIKKPATEFDRKEWDEMFNVNVTGTMLACREFGKIMIQRRKGKIINVSSIRGSRATLWGGNEAYCATKGAVDMITRALASEWAPHNINVNAIAPSLIATKLVEKTLSDPERLQRYIANVPLKRLGQPDDIVGASIFLASPASDFVTGQVIYLDGGASAVV